MRTAEQIDAEIERLEEQRREALTQAEDSDRKLEEMNERRMALAPPAFTGDEAADRELLTLEARAGRLSRKAWLARNTASELARLVEEAKVRRARRSAASISDVTWSSPKNATGWKSSWRRPWAGSWRGWSGLGNSMPTSTGRPRRPG